MSTSRSTTACTSAAADVTRAGVRLDKLIDQYVQDFLRHDSTYGARRNLEVLLHRVRQALSEGHKQPVALLALAVPNLLGCP